jgi:hypothetical protein
MKPNGTAFTKSNLNWRAGLYALVLLAAASISNGAQATPLTSANAGPTGSQGDGCRGSPPGHSGFFSASFSCTSTEGEGFTHPMHMPHPERSAQTRMGPASKA